MTHGMHCCVPSSSICTAWWEAWLFSHGLFHVCFPCLFSMFVFHVWFHGLFPDCFPCFPCLIPCLIPWFVSMFVFHVYFSMFVPWLTLYIWIVGDVSGGIGLPARRCSHWTNSIEFKVFFSCLHYSHTPRGKRSKEGGTQDELLSQVARLMFFCFFLCFACCSSFFVLVLVLVLVLCSSLFFFVFLCSSSFFFFVLLCSSFFVLLRSSFFVLLFSFKEG